MLTEELARLILSTHRGQIFALNLLASNKINLTNEVAVRDLMKGFSYNSASFDIYHFLGAVQKRLMQLCHNSQDIFFSPAEKASENEKYYFVVPWDAFIKYFLAEEPKSRIGKFSLSNPERVTSKLQRLHHDYAQKFFKAEVTLGRSHLANIEVDMFFWMTLLTEVSDLTEASDICNILGLIHHFENEDSVHLVSFEVDGASFKGHPIARPCGLAGIAQKRFRCKPDDSAKTGVTVNLELLDSKAHNIDGVPEIISKAIKLNGLDIKLKFLGEVSGKKSARDEDFVNHLLKGDNWTAVERLLTGEY